MENRHSKSISYFCPAFNEEDNLSKVVESAFTALKETGSNFEIIIVDNASVDNTPKIADTLAREIPEVKVIHHSHNREYGGALQSGFKGARNELVIYTDGDNQYDLGDIKTLLSYADKFDAVIGYRLKRHDSGYRIFQSGVFNAIIRMLFGLKVRDVNCSFKLYKKTVLDQIEISSNSAFIDAQMLIQVKNKGYRIFEVPVKHFARTAGKATGAKPAVVILTIKEILGFWIKNIFAKKEKTK
jgi:glycosyltransferase involved in cell wall biosynthesis